MTRWVPIGVTALAIAFLALGPGEHWVARYVDLLPQTPTELANYNVEMAEVQRGHDALSQRRREIGKRLKPLLDETFGISADKGKVLSRAPFYDALEATARERGKTAVFGAYFADEVRRQPYFAKWEKNLDTDPDWWRMSAGDRVRQLRRLSRFLDELGGLDTLRRDAAQRTPGRDGSLLAGLTAVGEIHRLLRIVAPLPPPVVDGPQLYAKLAPHLARFAPAPGDLKSADFQELYRIALANHKRSGDTGLGALEEVADHLAGMPTDVDEQVHHLHRTAHELANALRYILRMDEKWLTPSQRVTLEQGMANARAEEGRLCRKVGRNNRIGGGPCP